MNFKPLHDRVLIKQLAEEEKTAGGLYIPDTAKEKPFKGTVVAVGKGLVLDNGTVLPPDVQVGNTVLFGKYAGTDVTIEGQEYKLMREEDIQGILE